MLSTVIAGLNRHSLGQKKTEPDYPSQDVDTSGGEVEFVRLGRLLRNVGNFGGNFCNFCWLAGSGFGNVGMNFSPSRSNRSSFRRLAFASRPSTWIWISC